MFFQHMLLASGLVALLAWDHGVPDACLPIFCLCALMRVNLQRTNNPFASNKTPTPPNKSIDECLFHLLCSDTVAEHLLLGRGLKVLGRG